ncbi:hypothetical protein BLX88_23940, partial [Bacillus obstructivus]
ANSAQGIAQEVGEARGQEWILREPELSPDAARASLEAGLIQQLISRLRIKRPRLDLRIVELGQGRADRRRRDQAVAEEHDVDQSPVINCMGDRLADSAILQDLRIEIEEQLLLWARIGVGRG